MTGHSWDMNRVGINNHPVLWSVLVANKKREMPDKTEGRTGKTRGMSPARTGDIWRDIGILPPSVQ